MRAPGWLPWRSSSAACRSPARINPRVIHPRPEGKYQSVKSAPAIVIAEVLDYKLIPESPGSEGTKAGSVRPDGEMALQYRRDNFGIWIRI